MWQPMDVAPPVGEYVVVITVTGGTFKAYRSQNGGHWTDGTRRLEGVLRPILWTPFETEQILNAMHAADAAFVE